MASPQRDPELVARFEAESREPCVRAARTVAWIVLLVMPPFLLVDAARFPEQAAALGRLRMLGASAPVLLLLLLTTSAGRRLSRELTVLFSVIGAAFTTSQMAWTGGHASSYYAGIGLGMLLPALIMPWSAAWTWLNCALIATTYLVSSSLLHFATNDEALANNLFSYLATAVIAGVATMSRGRMRWREFIVRRQLEASQVELRSEAETSRTLAEAGREMMGLLEAPRVLDRLCALTTRTLRCDESHTVLRGQDGV